MTGLSLGDRRQPQSDSRAARAPARKSSSAWSAGSLSATKTMRLVREGDLSCTDHQADVREAPFGHGFDLVMMVYEQFNVFPRDRGLETLKKPHAALKPGASWTNGFSEQRRSEQRGLFRTGAH